MKLEHQVTNLEMSRKLKELGVKQESYFVWVDRFPVFNDQPHIASRIEFQQRLTTSILSVEAQALVGWYSAFTAAELGEMLPKTIRKGDTAKARKVWFGEQTTYIQYTDNEKEMIPMTAIAGSEADARAKMLIYLIEQNLM